MSAPSKEVNTVLREHVTSTAFSLTLTKRQMDFLILLHHFKGSFFRSYNHVRLAHASGSNAARYLDPIWLSNSQSLATKGLLVMNPDRPRFAKWQLTKAGFLVVGLLREAGIYQDRLINLGLVAA